MIVQFLKPTPNREGEVTPNIVAKVAVHHVSPLLPDLAIGGITIWRGDGSSKSRPKGVLSVSMPQYGAVSGRPVRVPGTANEDGDMMPDTYVASKGGVDQVRKFSDAILQAYSDAIRAGKDPFVGKFELAVHVEAPITPAISLQPQDRSAVAADHRGEDITDAELERLTGPATA
jgi:hypothetical protein